MTTHASSRSESSWMEDKTGSSFPRLQESIETDVCIVGAGIAGLSVAYFLAREGRDVVVLEAKGIGGGETARTTAHLSYALDEGFVSLEKMHGAEGAKKAFESHREAILTIERICGDEEISCDFTRLDGYLFSAKNKPKDELGEELEAAKRAGIEDVAWADKAPMPSYDTGKCLRFPDQAQFHPSKYLSHLARAMTKHGGKIFERTRVNDIKEGTELSVITEAGKHVRAKWLVVATNAPVYDNAAVFSRQAPYRTYVVGMEIAKGSVPQALFWDTLDPYHYVRTQTHTKTHDLLIVGGEDHKTGQENDMKERYKALEEWTRKHFPEAQRTLYRWSGQVLEPIDGLAMIGHAPLKAANVLIATGDSGHGMTHGTIAGMLLSDIILGRDNPWKDLYNPSRLRLSLESAKEFGMENANVAKEMIKDHVGPGEIASEKDVAKGSGAVLREGAKRIALYRDQAGKVHRKSAVCPHMGCIVHWNDGEKSWDCPCHGSRYEATGEVISGPTMHPLKESE